MKSVIKKLLAAREGFKDIKKDVKGYDYKYADLEGISHATDDALTEAGVHIYWDFRLVKINGVTWLKCDCVATDGETDHASTIYLPTNTLEKSRNSVQEMGKLYTYARRYSISALLNLVSEQDTDAAQPTVIEAPKSVTTAPPSQAAKPFVDTPAAWAWLESLFLKHNVTSDTTKKFIRENAVGKTVNELETAVSSAAQHIGDIK